MMMVNYAEKTFLIVGRSSTRNTGFHYMMLNLAEEKMVAEFDVFGIAHHMKLTYIISMDFLFTAN